MTESHSDATASSRRGRPHRHHYEADMLSVEEALARILSHFSVLSPEERPLVDAAGQVLAEDLRAGFDIPPLANSAMDGYAVRSADVAAASAASPVVLRVIDAVAAGERSTKTVARGAAIRIMTGAPVPDGADAVVPFEDTDELTRSGAPEGRDEIGVKLAVPEGENVRPAGEDVRRDALVLEKGTVLTPGAIGVAASLGRKTVRVVRRPVVSIVATGDELIEPGEPHRPETIYNSNSYSVAVAVKHYGGIPRLVGIARDTVASLNRALDEAMDGADMVITSAGVSKGDYDVVKDVLAQRGKIALWSVRMRPAKPLAFGVLNAPDGRKTPHLGLPGNPVSALVAFEQFARPAIRVMMGREARPKPTVQAVLDDAIDNYDGRRVYARVVVYRTEDGYRARLTGGQGSNLLTSMAIANGLAICPHDVARKEAGETVTVQMLEWPETVF